MNGNCYTYPLILPKVSTKDPENEGEFNPKATSTNCLDYALIYNDDFIEDCKQATLHAISEHRKTALKTLEEELAPPTASVAMNYHALRISKYFDNLRDNGGNDLTTLWSAFDTTPFRELIVQFIPINKICVKSERILWH